MATQESGDRSGQDPGAVRATDVIARLQELVDTRPVGAPVPLEWAVNAQFLGDVSGLACLSLRDD